ncbi:hypothetical protein Dcar01_02676 [Deinococcus carri]|uniref:Antitoxin Xre/MbcA/ParS-like toxin-binding domain-containing protein n=1 Tax=Deinococcus carri TaxID=1211323 RepID=A0ABP9W9A9_9DEIO
MTGLSRAAPDHSFFAALTNVSLPEGQIAPVLSGEAPVPSGAYTMQVITRQLKQLLGLNQDESARLLGVSRGTVIKAAPPTGDVLDRLYMLSDRFQIMQDLLGDQADDWFLHPNPVLGGARPIDKLRTRHGQAQLDDLIQALLDGNFA